MCAVWGALHQFVFVRVVSLLVCFFVSLSATWRENGWTDLHEIFREGVEWPWDDLIQFWVNSGKRVGGSKVNLFVITGHRTGVNKSVTFARWQQGLSPVIAQTTGINKSVAFAWWQQEAGFVVPRTTACIHLQIIYSIILKNCTVYINSVRVTLWLEI